MTIDLKKTPQNDFVFKELFAKEGNEDMLQEILEELLEIEIKEIEVLRDATIESEREENKKSIIDIKVTVNNDTVIDIEMQVKNEYNMETRSLFAGTALFHNSLKKGEDYNENKTAIVVSILSYNLFTGKDYIVSGRMRRDDNYEVITDKIQLYYLQLPKFLRQNKKSLDKKRKKLVQWLYFISQQDKEGLSMAIEENEKVAKAQKQLDEILADEKLMRQLEIREKTKLDRNSAISYAKTQGIKEGLNKGIKKGKKEEKIDIAKNMLKEGLSIKVISKVTELTKEEIEKLK